MMASSESINRLEYRTPHNVVIVPYKGDIAEVEAEAVVTRDDVNMEAESPATTSLLRKYTNFSEKRDILKKKTRILGLKRGFKLWSVRTTKLGDSSNPARFIFHAIMKQAGDLDGKEWEDNMEKAFLELLRKSEKHGVGELAVPLLGASTGNAQTIAGAIVKCIADHRPKHLQKVFLATLSTADMYDIITCCRRDLVLVHGNQPDGQMTVTPSDDHLPGLEEYTTLTITYSFPDGIQTDGHPSPGQRYRGITREAYLPDSDEGEEVAGLLRTAFDRKLIFTIGRSETTGQGNVVKWNGIPHKTSKEKGTKHSYPDPDYLELVKNNLANRGIVEGCFQLERTLSDSGDTEQVQFGLQTLRETLVTRNLSVRENGGKGDCLFVALSQQIEHVLDQKIGHNKVRKHLVKYFRENPNMPDGTPYANFLENESWNIYLRRMSKEGEWGDHLMLTAAANVYKVNIVVIKAEDCKETVIKPHEQSSKSFILGHIHHKHFVSVSCR